MAKSELLFDDGTDPSTFFQKKGMSFKEIVLNYLARLGTLASVEMRGGFWQKTQIIVNNQIISNDKYISDTREVYINSVKHLSNLLFSYFDSEMLAKYKELYGNKEFVKEKKHYSQGKLKVLEEQYKDKKDKEQIEEYAKKRLAMYEDYFKELNSFLNRVNYLDALGFIDGDE